MDNRKNIKRTPSSSISSTIKVDGKNEQSNEKRGSRDDSDYDHPGGTGNSGQSSNRSSGYKDYDHPKGSGSHGRYSIKASGGYEDYDYPRRFSDINTISNRGSISSDDYDYPKGSKQHDQNRKIGCYSKNDGHSVKRGDIKDTVNKTRDVCGSLYVKSKDKNTTSRPNSSCSSTSSNSSKYKSKLILGPKPDGNNIMFIKKEKERRLNLLLQEMESSVRELEQLETKYKSKRNSNEKPVVVQRNKFSNEDSGSSSKLNIIESGINRNPSLNSCQVRTPCLSRKTDSPITKRRSSEIFRTPSQSSLSLKTTRLQVNTTTETKYIPSLYKRLQNTSQVQQTPINNPSPRINRRSRGTSSSSTGCCPSSKCRFSKRLRRLFCMGGNDNDPSVNRIPYLHCDLTTRPSLPQRTIR